MRRFELIEGTSSKFWEVDLAGSSVTVRFGRIGTQGQSQTKGFSDPTSAKKEHDKLVKEKTGKGYVEVHVGPGTALTAVPVARAPTTAPKSTPAAAPTPSTSLAAPPVVEAAAVLSPPAVQAPAPSQIEWPRGGFEWDDALRKELPVVRGIRAPKPPLDGPTLLQNLVVLDDDRYRFTAPALAELGQKLGKTWTPWGIETSKSMISPESLAIRDHARWLELLAQTAYGRSANGSASGYFDYSEAAGWAAQVGVALHGPWSILEVTLDLMRAGIAASASFHHMGRLRPLIDTLRSTVAGASDADHDAVVDLLQNQASSTPLDRLLRAYLCPHRQDWVMRSLADAPHDEYHLLGCGVMPPEQGLAYLKGLPPYVYILKRPVLLQIHLHNEDAIDLLAYVLGKADDKRSLEEWLALAERMHSPRLLPMLAQSMQHKEVRAVLDKLARRWPAAVLYTAIERALSTRSRLEEGWAVRMALREPQALADAMAALGESERTRFSAVLAQLQCDDVTEESLPPVLRQPPWLGKARATELPTLEVARRSVPDRVDFGAEEKARLAALQPHPWIVNRVSGQPAHYLQEELQLTPEGATLVLQGAPLAAEHVKITKLYFYGASVEVLLALPAGGALALWNSYPARHWHAWGNNMAVISAMLARHGEAALPGLVAYAESNPESGLELALPVDSARLVPTALHALRNLKKAKAPAMAWLRAHAATALTEALPLAFGRANTARDDARFALRWIVSHGLEEEARRIAAGYGQPMAQALQALLDADPLLVLPARMPKLPGFFVAASFRRPELRNGGGALPVTAMEHIGSMLAISKLDAPYAGLASVREACTADSLAEFAWDLYEAWAAAGNPSKDNWAFYALGLLGNDETARRLAPRIREWPGEGGHQRAVTGLDLLAHIGSDVALMHLNGVASKVKFKALQDRAKEKIAAVAEARGFTAAELADRLVPDLGLNELGTVELDFGPRQFHVAFDETLKPFVKDVAGARLKDLPKPLKSDDAAKADAATERYKQIKKDAKAVASLQVTRLELAMIDRRRWSAEDFRLFFLEHPLMRHLATRLMWGVYGEGDALEGAFRVAEDWTLADAEDNAFILPEGARVGIAHVLEIPDALLGGFGQVFADYEILQPFKQLGRETYALTDAERQADRLTRFASKTVATGSVMGLVNRGWERGQAQDAGWVGWFSKAVGDGLQVDLELEPGTIVGDLSYEPKQTLPAITLRKAGSWAKDGLVPFAQLHPIVASEVLRDIDLLAPLQDA